MKFDLIKPNRGKYLRLLLYLVSFVLFTAIAVLLSFLAYSSFIKLPFFIENFKFTAITIILITVVSMLLLNNITRALIDKSEVIGSLIIQSERIIIDLKGSFKSIQNDDIKFIRFANAMGWSISSPDAYQIQIVLKDGSEIDIEYIRAKNKKSSLKYFAKKNGIETRYWNLA
ncbi:hypothetical protein [Pleomorphovibrio marinus]|uniref:hypothetical protein n=1 Tax=Pleomorphovibrio marinus TaxID=2164132 RepID=UPI000E0B84FE|nr:hypothetical protein [Pleomorphovibrio marinus]